MAILLCIDTAVEKASVCISDGTRVLAENINDKQADHASWIHQAISEALIGCGKNMQDLQAVAVVAGPGSYTGLRVGMATAKGICYALNIPLITESTLHLIAYGARAMDNSAWICPMVDARRMEVYTAVYDPFLQEQLAPAAMILEERSFQNLLDQQKIIFAGNGAVKWKNKCAHTNALFYTEGHPIVDFAAIADQKYKAGDFTDLVYSEPSYLKNVYFNN